MTGILDGKAVSGHSMSRIGRSKAYRLIDKLG